MTRFTFVTLFASLMEGYFGDSILSRAIKEGRFSVDFADPREFTKDRHKKVDDYQAGGGAGMLMMMQPLVDTLENLSTRSSHIIFATPAGKPFRQVDAKRLAQKEHLIFVSGRYEGFDERLIEHYADELFSVGDAILTGGELPSLFMCDAIARQIPGVVGNVASLEGESFEEMLLEPPAFTKRGSVTDTPIIKEYLKGNHGKIQALKKRLSYCKTSYFRPDLYQKAKSKDQFKET